MSASGWTTVVFIIIPVISNFVTSVAIVLANFVYKRYFYFQSPKLTVKELERAMWEAVERLDFERAATLRDLIAKSRGKTPERTGRKGTPHPPARGRRRRQ